MNLVEARALLEVSSDATELEIRRAYLRKIKTCKPEADPEGFKRIREAYELASEGTAIGAAEDVPETSASEVDLASGSGHTTAAEDPAAELLALLMAPDPVAAGREFVRTVESAIDDGRVAEIPPELVVRFGLMSFTAGRRKRSGALVRKWFAAASRAGVIDASSSHDLSLLAMIELARLPRATPVEFVQAMAGGLLSGDAESASQRLVELVGQQPIAGEALRYAVFGDAPVLRAVYGRALRGQSLLSRITYFFVDHPRLNAAMFVIAVVVTGLLRTCNQ